MAVATARAGNVVGGGDFAADRILPDAVRAFTRRALEVRFPEAVRPWQHVLEPLSGYLTLAEQAFRQGGDFAEAWNFGPGGEANATSDPVGALHRGLGRRCALDARRQGPRHEVTALLRLDATKSRDRLGWRPLLGFDDMVTGPPNGIAHMRAEPTSGADLHPVTPWLDRRLSPPSPFRDRQHRGS